MEVIILGGIALAVNKTVTVIKALTSKAWRTALTQVVVWVVGTIAIAACAHAGLVQHYTIPGLGVTFGSLDAASTFLLGWMLGSSGSFAFDVKRAIDGSDSAMEPPLGV